MSTFLSFLFPSPVAQGLTGIVVAGVTWFAPILWRALVTGEKAAVASVEQQVGAAPPPPAKAP